METLCIISLLFSCFFMTRYCIKLFIKRAYRNGILDIPNARKLQKKATPTSGGIPMYIALFVILIIAFIVGFVTLNELLITCFGGLTLILGFIDDQKNLKAKTRFLIEVLIGIGIASLGYRIYNFNGFLGLYELPIVIQYVITVFGFILIINAFNLIDGVDGLLGGISLINMGGFSCAFIVLNQYSLAMYCLIVFIMLLAFLTLNFNPAKIFMGDAGALFIGTITTVLAIELVNIKSIEGSFYHMLVFGMIMIPVFDTLRVFLIRMLRSKSPFLADQNHAHHYLIKFGFNHKKVAVCMYLSHALIVMLPLFFYRYLGNDTLVLLLLAVICLSEVITYKKVISHKIYKLKKRMKRKEILKETPFIQKHI